MSTTARNKLLLEAQRLERGAENHRRLGNLPAFWRAQDKAKRLRKLARKLQMMAEAA